MEEVDVLKKENQALKAEIQNLKVSVQFFKDRALQSDELLKQIESLRMEVLAWKAFLNGI